MEQIVNSFQYGLPAAVIIAIYLIVIKVLDVRKDKKKIEMSGSLISTIDKLNNFLEFFTRDIIKKEQDKCEHAIKSSFDGFSKSLIKFSITTIINNNVHDNSDLIKENVTQLVKTEFWNVYTCLSLFNANDCRVCEYLDKSWKTELIDDICSIIFDNKLDKEHRIYMITNKIDLVINSFCVHVINKYKKNAK